jgi:hypothetical protein
LGNSAYLVLFVFGRRFGFSLGPRLGQVDKLCKSFPDTHDDDPKWWARSMADGRLD